MIIWLASFPKSGNTWVRSIVSSLIYSDDGIFNFNLIKKISQFPSVPHFTDFTNAFNDINEIKKYWILAQEKINIRNQISFLKTHHLNCTIDNFSFTNTDQTAGTIYIVRDPRNLINSISNHFSKNQTQAKEFLFRTNLIDGSKSNLENQNIVTLIGSWKDHYNYWTKKNDKLLLIKYEDILLNPKKELSRIIGFLKKLIKFDTNDTKEKNILNSTSFSSLSEMEQRGEFKENVFSKISNNKIKFFNQGPNNIWQKYLDEEIKLEIESKLEKEMKELGYL